MYKCVLNITLISNYHIIAAIGHALNRGVDLIDITGRPLPYGNVFFYNYYTILQALCQVKLCVVAVLHECNQPKCDQRSFGLLG